MEKIIEDIVIKEGKNFGVDLTNVVKYMDSPYRMIDYVCAIKEIGLSITEHQELLENPELVTVIARNREQAKYILQLFNCGCSIEKIKHLCLWKRQGLDDTILMNEEVEDDQLDARLMFEHLKDDNIIYAVGYKSLTQHCFTSGSGIYKAYLSVCFKRNQKALNKYIDTLQKSIKIDLQDCKNRDYNVIGVINVARHRMMGLPNVDLDKVTPSMMQFMDKLYLDIPDADYGEMISLNDKLKIITYCKLLKYGIKDVELANTVVIVNQKHLNYFVHQYALMKETGTCYNSSIISAIAEGRYDEVAYVLDIILQSKEYYHDEVLMLK